MDLNSALVETYRKYWSNLKDIINETEIANKDINYPLLIHVFPEFGIAPVKLFVVGQQTHGGRKSIKGDPIEYLTKYYENFQLGKEYMRVPFWRAQHLLYRKLNPSGPRLGFVWTNLIKIDHHKDRPPKDIEDQICTAFPVLPLEIQIAKPDVVVFFTGPRYDARLKKTFEGLTFEPICGYKVRTLARVVHKNLPYNSFRTYHPSYIVRSLNLPEIVDKIVASIS